MKKMQVALVTFLLVFSTLLVSCGKNPFLGTWVTTDDWGNSAKITFEKDNVFSYESTVFGVNLGVEQGSYKYEGEEVVLVLDGAIYEVETVGVLVGNTITTPDFGTFTKQE